MKKILIILATILILAACKENRLSSGNYVFSKESAKVGSFPASESVSLELPDGYEYSEIVSIPGNLQVTQGTDKDQIFLRWNKVEYDREKVGYLIYRAVSGGIHELQNNGEIYFYTELEQSLNRGEIVAGMTYEFYVLAVVPSKKISSRKSTSVIGYTLSNPTKFGATLRASTDMVFLNWTAVPGARYYTIQRAEADENGNPPKFLYQYKSLGKAITGLKYEDLSVVKNGELVSYKEYFYILFAHLDEKTYTTTKNPVKGAVLSVGAPPQIELVHVSSGLIQNGVRIMWKKQDADSYSIYRLTDEDFASGNVSGNKVVEVKTGSPFFIEKKMNIAGIEESVCIWYDRDPAISAGAAYYYRIAGKNTIGEGKCSSIDSSEDLLKSRGLGMRFYLDEKITVGVTRLGYRISWPVCQGAAGYYVYRMDSKPAAANQNQWTSMKYVEQAGWLDPAAGYDLESKEMFYRVLPADSRFISETLVLNKAVTYFEDQTITSIEEELENTGFSPIFAQAGFSAFSSDYTVPVPNFTQAVAASKDSDNCRGTIEVKGKISDISGFEKLNVKLIRKCGYGDETGVYPLYEPRKSIGGVAYSKQGKPNLYATEEIDLKPYINGTGEFQFIDMMHDFRDGMPIPDEKESDGIRKHIWNYAAWDNEAWKDIKRKKPFDMERAVKVNYEVRIERKSDAEWNPCASADIGWPALTDKEFAHLINWLKDTAMNRMSLILVPRYSWNKTLEWVVGFAPFTQEIKGEYNNKTGTNGRSYIRIIVDNVTGKGNGGICDGYSDWPGFVLGSYDNGGNYQEITMSVELTSGIRNIGGWFTIDTPLYDGTMYYSIYVWDYNYHWGLKNDGGEVTIFHKGRQVKLVPSEVMIMETDVKGLGFGREKFDAGDDPYPYQNSFTNTCNYTRINFKYRPYPVNLDFSKERLPVMYYQYNY